MWALKNRTPYAAERTWVRDRSGAHHWIVAVKATFDLGGDGALALADEQLPPLRLPEHFGDPASSSLRQDADLGPLKPTTDVTLLGQAYAPGGRPATRVPVSLRVGDQEKSLVVFGERTYEQTGMGILPSSAAPFLSQPIQYELAYGGADLEDPDPRRQGIDLRNPVGCGVAADSRRLVGRRAASIEYPHGDPARVGPAGFGPIASHWSPRLELWGTYDARWEQTRKPLLPDDYDERATLCAPADQRPPRHLTGGEPVELVNLTPSGRLRFVLPKIFLTFTTLFGSRREEHRGRLTGVVIEPDERRLQVVWQSTLAVLGREEEYLDATVIREKPYLQLGQR